MMKKPTYREAGVDIDRGDRFVDFIRGLSSSMVHDSIGDFSGGLDLELDGYRQPVLLSTCDGVGTKLLVAKGMGRYDTIGIDLVAMCVNDLIVCGADPILFQDYIACGKIDESVLHSVIQGIVRGCETAGCPLTGGETAEMPDMYEEDAFDLAGFAAGIVEKADRLPRLGEIKSGAVVLGLPSSGIHSNGLTLARKILTDPAEWQQLLIPTEIYVPQMRILLEKRLLLASAHITGGGLEANIRRVIPSDLWPQLDYLWPRPEIFRKIQDIGHVGEEEMRRVFNLGVGMALIVAADRETELISLCEDREIDVLRIGHLERRGS
jgi:phosphoribosylaminoimidazole synthetase